MLDGTADGGADGEIDAMGLGTGPVAAEAGAKPVSARAMTTGARRRAITRLGPLHGGTGAEGYAFRLRFPACFALSVSPRAPR